MTVSTTSNTITHIADGVGTTYVYDFRIDNAEDAVVNIGAVILNYPADFTITGLGDDLGGAIETTVVYAASTPITITRVVPLTQEMDYIPYGPFDAESHEAALDKLTFMIQQISGEALWGGIGGTLADQLDLQAALDALEPDLGNPAADGYSLISTVAGVRTWVDLGSNFKTFVADATPTDDVMFPLLVGDNTVGSLDVASDAGISYNASTNTLFVQNTVGDLAGNASSANVASTVDIGIDATNIARNILFAGGSGIQTISFDAGDFSYNPFTNAFVVNGSAAVNSLIINGVTVTKTATEINRSINFPDAAATELANVATRASTFLGFDAAGNLAYLAGGGSATSAALVSIADVGGFYAAADVEAAFQELPTSVGAGIIGLSDPVFNLYPSKNLQSAIDLLYSFAGVDIVGLEAESSGAATIILTDGYCKDGNGIKVLEKGPTDVTQKLLSDTSFVEASGSHGWDGQGAVPSSLTGFMDMYLIGSVSGIPAVNILFTHGGNTPTLPAGFQLKRYVCSFWHTGLDTHAFNQGGDTVYLHKNLPAVNPAALTIGVRHLITFQNVPQTEVEGYSELTYSGSVIPGAVGKVRLTGNTGPAGLTTPRMAVDTLHAAAGTIGFRFKAKINAFSNGSVFYEGYNTISANSFYVDQYSLPLRKL